MSGEGEDVEALLAAKFGNTRGSTESRREKETRATPYASRRRRGGTRTEQLNLSFRQGFKKRLIGASDFARETMTEFVERAVEDRIKAIGWGEE